jgi:heavy metal translocating P-type ATPase
MVTSLDTPETVHPAVSPRRTRWAALPEMRWAGASVALFLLGLGLSAVAAPAWSWWTAYLLCYAAGGWEPGLAGLQALRARTLDVDLLMVVAAIAAAAIGQVTDGALLIVIFATSGALEALATARTQDAVRGLLDLAPDTATRLGPDGDERRVPVADLVPGDVVLVRPGERIAADGVVVDGAGDVDQATITGEPLPVARAAGDEVFAGTLNRTGALWVRVRRAAADSVLARIVALVDEAARTKARTQLFVERIEQRYSIGMVAATAALFVVPLLAGDPLPDALLRAMTFMIVASPCAVVLATMPPLLAAIATAGRHGVLIKSAVAMEQLGTVTRVAFDKTGTLTHGTPELATVVPDTESSASGTSIGTESSASGTSINTDTEKVLALAAAVEAPSEHPLAAAVLRAAHERGLTPLPVREFTALPGRGVRGRVDGRLVQVLSPAAVPDLDAATRRIVDELERAGQTAVVVLADDRPLGVLGLTDRTRDGARAAVAALTRLTGTAPILLTGDNTTTAARLGAELGLSDVRAGLLPADKLDAVQALRAQGHRVLVVGDGVNDAPALAAAHSGVAMGGTGADLARQSADVVVVRDELGAIPAVVALSRRAQRVVRANLVIAAVFIAGLVTLDLLGHLPLPLGVLGHEGSTVLVGLNGLRLLRRSAWVS